MQALLMEQTHAAHAHDQERRPQRCRSIVAINRWLSQLLHPVITREGQGRGQAGYLRSSSSRAGGRMPLPRWAPRSGWRRERSHGQRRGALGAPPGVYLPVSRGHRPWAVGDELRLVLAGGHRHHHPPPTRHPMSPPPASPDSQLSTRSIPQLKTTLRPAAMALVMAKLLQRRPLR
jgi:hypothetical protein